jgi:hypothetical protein
VDCRSAAEAGRLLRNEAPFGPVRVRNLQVSGLRRASNATLLALAADAAAYASLKKLAIVDAALDAPAVLDAVVDASLARGLSGLSLVRCRLSPASAPALARLLGGGTLKELVVRGDGFQLLLDADAAQVLGAALGSNSTLTAVTLINVGLWRDVAASAAVLVALTAHPSLRTLVLDVNAVDAAYQAAVGAALGALVAADAPALHVLSVSYCGMSDAALGPLVDALLRNTHLRALRMSGNRLSEAFAAARLLPAVRANAALRELVLRGGITTPERMLEAFVRERERRREQEEAAHRR